MPTLNEIHADLDRIVTRKTASQAAHMLETLAQLLAFWDEAAMDVMVEADLYGEPSLLDSKMGFIRSINAEHDRERAAAFRADPAWNFAKMAKTEVFLLQPAAKQSGQRRSETAVPWLQRLLSRWRRFSRLWAAPQAAARQPSLS